MPAYNAEQTLRQTYAEIPFDIVDHVVLVDDASSDHTSDVVKTLLHIINHLGGETIAAPFKPRPA